ncbi:MAG: hypothetical protein ACREPY_14705 [Rhodanobacteraceae bacterium]
MSAPKLTGNRCQCPTCGEYFNGVQGFDKHRTGDYAKPGNPNTRRCLTVAQMRAEGFERNAAGFWTTETRAQRITRHRATGVQGPRAPSARQHYCPAPKAPEIRASATP